MDRIINVKVTGSRITKDNRNAGVRGEANSKVLRIEFDPGWDGYAKSITFWNALGLNPVKQDLTVDKLEDATRNTRVYLCPIPGEVMDEAGLMVFVIDGAVAGEKIRSEPDNLYVEDAPEAEDAGIPAEPTPSQWEQMQAQYEYIVGTLQQAFIAADRAEAAAIRQPVIQNGTWWVWAADAGMYVDTGTPAQADGEVFVAEYGKTTFAELEEAYGKYKVLFCREGNYLSPMYSRTPGVNMCFYRNNADVTINAFCKPDGWHKSVRHLCEEALGDIEAALDSILAMQEGLMGGDGE